MPITSGMINTPSHKFKQILIAATISSLFACGGGGSDSPAENKVINQSPTANAGTNQTVDENTVVTLLGSGTDTDGSIASYHWSQTGGTTITLSEGNTASATFTAPNISADETLTFELTITDNDGATAVASIDVQVKNSPPITLSGVVYDEIVEGATVILKDGTGNQVSETTSNELGQYSVTFDNNQSIDSCYTLTASGGVMGGVDFTESLTATYCGEFIDLNAINITPITTLIDVIAQNSNNSDLNTAHQEAKQQLIAMGMLSDDNDWNDLGANIINYGMLSLEVKSAGSVTAWVDEVIADMSDLQISPSRVSNVFKQAHGGIEKVITADVSLFAGQSKNINVTSLLSDNTLAHPSAYSLSDAPEWITLDGSSLTIAPSTEIVAGQYSYQISATPSNGSQSRINTFNVEVLASVILLEGTLDSSGGDIRNQFQDIVLTAPAGVLTQSYNIIYRASIDKKGALITNMTTTPDMTNLEVSKMSLVKPSTEILIQNYLQALLPTPQAVSQQSKGNIQNVAKISSSSDEENTYSDYDSSLCHNDLGDSWQDRNRDGSSFDNVITCFNANFLQTSDLIQTVDPSANLVINSLTGEAFTYQNLINNDDLIVEKRAFVLRSVSEELDSTKIPVLFVHGFVRSGALGGFDYDDENSDDISGEYFGTFPRLVDEYNTENGDEFSPYLFQWRTNIPFEVAAHYLGIAINELATQTGKKVHIVAHSFGGIVSRTLIQGLAQNHVAALEGSTTFNREFSESHIASLTTVGTPHSGIFPTEEANSYNNSTLNFPEGTSTIYGLATNFCEAISCHQVGINTELLLLARNRLCGGDCTGLANGKDVWFGMREDKGAIAHLLREKLDTDGWPNIKTQVLIGLIGDTDLNHSNPLNIEGDGLISIAGQRFDAAGESESNAYKDLLTIGNYQRFNGSEKIDEHFLGFQEFNEAFTSDTFLFRSYTGYYLADLKGDGVFNLANRITIDTPDNDSITLNRTVTGYNHRTDAYNKRFGSRLDMASEVGIQECTTLSPEYCRHNTWQYFTSFMSMLNLDDTVAADEQITLTGRIGNFDQITGGVKVSYSINNYIETGIFFLENGESGSFIQEITFIPNAEYEITFTPLSDSGFRPKVLILETESSLNASSLAIGQTIMFDEVYQDATIILEVVDAISGNDIVDYQVDITNLEGSVNYTDQTLLTDGVQLAPGDYTFNISSGDYITKSKQCSAVGSASNLCRIELVRPVSEEDAGKLTAILSWQVDPRDLDTHLVKYDLSGDQQYHIYYSHKNDSATGDNLDRDDTSSYGPETLTIQNVDAESIYVYYVYDYAGSGSITTTSLAQVDVTNFFSAIEPFQAAYQAPTSGEGRFWKVFEVRNGVVEPCRTDCIMDSTPTRSLSSIQRINKVSSSNKKELQLVPKEIYQSISFE